MCCQIYFWWCWSNLYCQNKANLAQHGSQIGPNVINIWSKIGLGPSRVPVWKKQIEKWLPSSNCLKPLGGHVGGSWGPRGLKQLDSGRRFSSFFWTWFPRRPTTDFGPNVDSFWTKFSLHLHRCGCHVGPNWLCFGSKNSTSTSKNRFGKTFKIF